MALHLSVKYQIPSFLLSLFVSEQRYSPVFSSLQTIDLEILLDLEIKTSNLEIFLDLEIKSCKCPVGFCVSLIQFFCEKSFDIVQSVIPQDNFIEQCGYTIASLKSEIQSQ